MEKEAKYLGINIVQYTEENNMKSCKSAMGYGPVSGW